MAESPDPEQPKKNGELVYDEESKAKFKQYFTQPSAKKGRSKKKKRGRPSKRKIKKTRQIRMRTAIDLTSPKKKKLAGLDARLHGAVESSKRYSRSGVIRTNWDDAKHAAVRDRIANSWEQKNDLYVEGESFNRFCVRTDISRNVLKRYLEKRMNGDNTGCQRGRPALLNKSVMVHLCELLR